MTGDRVIPIGTDPQRDELTGWGITSTTLPAALGTDS
jgi:hypothetical protein